MMFEFLSTSGFPARWHCGAWDSFTGWQHVLNGAFIAAVYFVCAAFILRNGRGAGVSRPVVVLGSLFFVFCGGSHAIQSIIFWWPIYRFLGYWETIEFVLVVACIVTMIRQNDFKTPTQIEFRDAELMAIGDASTVPYYVANLEGECTFMNAAMANLIGYSREHCIGKDIHSLIHHSLENGEPRDRLTCDKFKAMSSGEVVVVDKDIVWTKSGLVTRVLSRAIPLRIRGQVRGVLVEVTPKMKPDEAIRYIKDVL